jgi:beta-glucosidase
LAPHSAFTRITNNSGTIATEQTPTQLVNVTNEITAHRNSLPDVDITGNLNIKLLDVYRNKEDMNDFIGQLSEQDLADLTCAYYDGAEPGGVPGRTALMGGTTENLRNFGYATVSNTDGPAGMRVQVQSTQAPSGTTLAATFNNDLVKKLYEQIGKETRQEGSSELLGPGMDIHRDPLCGRNFEYFSEDPLLTGMMAASVVEGLQSQGISATPKHFAANNQETNRTTENERVSERALREIHLKAFEIVTKTSKPLNIMTSYNQVNER